MTGKIIPKIKHIFILNTTTYKYNSVSFILHNFSGALSIEIGEVGDYPLYNQKISCTGCEHSLTECDRSQTLASKCMDAATVTCKGKFKWYYISDITISFNLYPSQCFTYLRLKYKGDISFKVVKKQQTLSSGILQKYFLKPLAAKNSLQ